MRKHDRKRNIWGRRIVAMLLLCGILLPVLQQTNAATVTYEYKWIKNTAELPTDNQWHDYFIAWEDTDDNKLFWFTDYHWYTAEGYNNYDAGGSHWMEYKAASTLSDSTSSSFTSNDCLGHMQIKYAGIDNDNVNSPMYYIRVSKMHGGYMYFTEYEPSSDIDDAEPFTFEDKGDVFHIFVNISGKADRYLTRDGQYLETTESSSYGGGDYYRPLRVYRRTFTIQETEQGDMKDSIGKVTLYEYSWVNTVEELMALANNSKQWTDIILAWEDADGSGTSNPDKVWYTKEVWYEENSPNYDNDTTEYQYWSNDTLGSDGYSSAHAETFLLPSKTGHFQIKHTGWDSDNPIDGYTNAAGKTQNSPTFQFRFDIDRQKYLYVGEWKFKEDPSDAKDYTVQLRLDKKNSDDIYGSMHIFINKGWGASDVCFTRKGNRLDRSLYWYSKNWEFPFRIYTCRPVEYDAIVKSFTIGKGATYSIDKQLILNKGVTITVEDGGVLIVDDHLLNNGNIIVKNGGTVIVNEGAYIMAYDKNAEGTISLDGGNLIILEDAKVICDQNGGTLQAINGSTILNYGFLMVGNRLVMHYNSVLKNKSNATLLLGGRIQQERGGVGAFTFEEIEKRVLKGAYTSVLSNNAKIINDGKLIQSSGFGDIDISGGMIPNGDGTIRFGK